jgi:hypothetical protein
MEDKPTFLCDGSPDRTATPSAKASVVNYARDVEVGRQLLQMASRAELESSASYWELAELTFRVTESGVAGKQWASDIGCSPSRVSTFRTIWRKFGDRKHSLRFRDAYHAALTPRTAEELIAEAAKLGLSVSGLRQRKTRGNVVVPSQRIQDPILKNVVGARSAILRAADALNAGRTPEDAEAVRSVAEEIRDGAELLLETLKQSDAVPLRGVK